MIKVESPTALQGRHKPLRMTSQTSEPITGSYYPKKEEIAFIGGFNTQTHQPFTTTLHLQTQGGVVAESKENEEYFISGADVGLPEVRVSTNGKYIHTMIKFAEKKKRMEVLRIMKSLDAKIRASDVDALYTQGGDSWRDFCSDIVDYYCFRFRVFKIPMPVCITEPESKD